MTLMIRLAHCTADLADLISLVKMQSSQVFLDLNTIGVLEEEPHDVPVRLPDSINDAFDTRAQCTATGPGIKRRRGRPRKVPRQQVSSSVQEIDLDLNNVGMMLELNPECVDGRVWEIGTQLGVKKLTSDEGVIVNLKQMEIRDWLAIGRDYVQV
ncbi:putative zinc finger and BTB domain-containing protein 48 [Sesbania bispinosa]|nr:putative zinc finger and BTB domain-containing protein 48 [Sesbania bispinosa]